MDATMLLDETDVFRFLAIIEDFGAWRDYLVRDISHSFGAETELFALPCCRVEAWDRLEVHCLCLYLTFGPCQTIRLS